MKKADPLLLAKLRLPFTRTERGDRPRLRERITQGLRGPLTLITAPAGFGKTTLARIEFARGNPAEAAGAIAEAAALWVVVAVVTLANRGQRTHQPLARRPA